MSYLGNGVFRGTKLNNVIGNNNFIWKDNLLISSNVIYYGNSSSVKVQEHITMIADYAFADSNLTSIELNNVTNVGLYAFYNSNLTTITNYDHLDTISCSAFVGTPWFKNNINEETKTLVLGKVLIYMYSEDEVIVVPKGVERIIANSVVGNNAKCVVISDTVKYINGSSFNNTKKLESLILDGTVPPNITDTSVNSNVILYVKDGYLNTYLNDPIYKVLPNKITTKAINITFKDIDGKIIGTKEEIYYSTFDNYILPKIPTGKELSHFVDENGNVYHIKDVVNSYDDLILTPVLIDSIYQVNFGNNSLNIKYGEEVNFGIPNKDGYTFVGWYANDSTKITDSSGKCIWNRTNEVEQLEARYQLNIYNLYLESDMGTFLGDKSYTFTVEEPLRANNLADIKEYGYYFLGWYLGDEVFDTTYNFYQDLTLRARWEGVKVSVNPNTVSYVIKDKVSIIDISSLNLSYYYIFTIKSNVTHATFIGDGYHYKLRIIIESADTAKGDSAIVLSLKNINISALHGTSDVVINAYEKSLIINYSGINSITGAKGANGTDGKNYYNKADKNYYGSNGENGTSGADGVVAIRAYKVHLYSDDKDSKITITGGAGGNGGNGGHGQDGGDGLTPPSGSMFKPVKGDDGRSGGSGGKGGTGGDGSYAIIATKITVEDFNTCELIGGRGGNGGYAGNGGRGGNGASDSSANPFTGVGEPGDGGNGGKGGNGGNGGNGSAPTSDSNVKGTGGLGGNYGNLGNGGEGGSGGLAGTYGDPGKDGSTGIKGSNGINGEIGNTGNSFSGSTGGLASHGNLFSNKFYINCVI